MDGRRLRALTIVDVFTRESLAIEVGRALKGTAVVEVLNGLRSERSAPKVLFCGNGSEFTGQIMDLWTYQNGVKIDLSRPGKPTDNAFMESFNGTLRADSLDAHWFATLAEAKKSIEAWRKENNESRPHGALGERTPNEFVKESAASRARWVINSRKLALNSVQESRSAQSSKKSPNYRCYKNRRSRQLQALNRFRERFSQNTPWVKG
jgi:putative transposase